MGATADPYLTSAGGAIMSAAPLAGPAAPFVAIGGAIVSFLGQMGVGSGCGQQCVLSTQYANKASALLEQNIQAYFAVPAPRPQSVQSAALNNFMLIWNDLEQQCSNPSLGSPGQRCITDRQAGACTWKQTGQPEFPGQPANGTCWNWWNSFHDPIANDPNVVPDSALANPALDAVTQSALSNSPGGSAPTSTSSMLPWILAAAAAAFIVSTVN